MAVNGRILYRLWQAAILVHQLGADPSLHAIYNGYFNSRLLTVSWYTSLPLTDIGSGGNLFNRSAAYIMHLRPADLLKHMKPDFIY